MGPTSKEHLVHVAVGRVILANKRLTAPDVRRHLQSDYFREFEMHSPFPEGEPLGRAWLNGSISGLICRECNQGWARELEESAGKALYAFTLERRAAEARLLRRWAWYFAAKMWFSNHRTEGLSDGPLVPILEKLATPSVSIEMPVRVAVVDASPRDWRFAGLAMGWAAGPDPFIAWIIRGVLWMVVASDNESLRLPVRTAELVEGVVLHRIPRVRKRDIRRLFSCPPASFPDGRSAP